MTDANTRTDALGPVLRGVVRKIPETADAFDFGPWISGGGYHIIHLTAHTTLATSLQSRTWAPYWGSAEEESYPTSTVDPRIFAQTREGVKAAYHVYSHVAESCRDRFLRLHETALSPTETWREMLLSAIPSYDLPESMLQEFDAAHDWTLSLVPRVSRPWSPVAGGTSGASAREISPELHAAIELAFGIAQQLSPVQIEPPLVEVDPENEADWWVTLSMSFEGTAEEVMQKYETLIRRFVACVKPAERKRISIVPRVKE